MSLTISLLLYPLFLVGLIAGWAAEDPLARRFLESNYELPMDRATEMTDVILVNACLTNHAQIQQLAERMVSQCEAATSGRSVDETIRSILSGTPIGRSVQVLLMRERTTGQSYRLDISQPLSAFRRYTWGGGAFTNEFKFPVAQISLPPEGSVQHWTLLTVQPAHRHVTVQSGPRPLMAHEGFYLSLFGLPPALRFNVILQTAVLDDVKFPSPAERADPGGYHLFQMDARRAGALLDGSAGQGTWHSRQMGEDLVRLAYISPDGRDQSTMVVLANAADLRQRHLAYVRDPKSGAVVNLYAWSYDESGAPDYFLNLQAGDWGPVKASLQNIVHVEKTARIDRALFSRDYSIYESVYDTTVSPAVQTLRGKVVFEAGKARSDHSSSVTRLYLIRGLLAGLLLLTAVGLFLFARRRPNP